ncbi:hypothetical protein LIER_04303 [Lithospermum erythrorhizon]|uniref:NAC domain-containing protein n=1 Tax=Lithospermum erythrorhizon TaxID=34254 RepID=A0AAV3NWA0_LITER
MKETTYEIEMPGFRFHPTEEELLDFYLKNTVIGKKLHHDVIGFLNIYRHDPSDLPGLAKIGEREWYFFVPRDRRHGTAGRPNRTTEHGFWKATGVDRKIFGLSEPKRVIGLKKTLVFYKGKAPRGTKSDWIMNEYRLPDKFSSPGSLKDVVLCKIYKKATSLKALEQRAAMEEAMMKRTTTHQESYHSAPPPPAPLISSFIDAINPISIQQGNDFRIHDSQQGSSTNEEPHEKESEWHIIAEENSSFNLQFPASNGALPELQIPKFTMDWNQDPICTPFRSPWLENISTLF